MARIVMETARGIQKHFPTRAGEWFCAFVLTDWGARVAMPDRMFDTSASFRAMETIFTEQWWGILAVMLGISRLIALAVNGTFHETLWYSRRSPHIRMMMAGLSMFVWTMICIGLWRSGVNTTGKSIYPYLIAFDFWNAIRAGRDAGQLDGSQAGAARRQPALA